MRVAIVGAGLLGLTTAHFLNALGAEVAVFERRAGPGEETSFANGGMLHASQANPWNEPGVLWRAIKMLGREDAALLVRMKAFPELLRWGAAFVHASNPTRYLKNFSKNARLAAYSIAQMAVLRESCAFDYDFQQRGTLKIFRTQTEVATAAALCRQLSEWGIEYSTVTHAEVVALEPALAPIQSKLAGGLYFPQDEAGDANKFCVSVAASLVARGVTFRYQVPITHLVRERSKHVRVHTAHNVTTWDAVVLAAGSYTPQLARSMGLRVPVAPVKGYSLTLPLNGWSRGPSIPVIDDHLHAAVCPLGERLRVAGTAEFTGFDLTLTQSRIDNLYRLVSALYPDFILHLDRAQTQAWTGLRPMSSDGVGIMGATAVPGLYLNTGHGPLGWTMAAGAGRLVAEQILGIQSALSIEPYLHARF